MKCAAVRRLAPILCALLALASPPSWSLDRGDFLADAAAQGKASLRVLWVASAGWAEADMAGRTRGVSIELMREFARWLEETQGLDIELDWVEEDDWRRFYARVRDGEGGLFGLGNVTITEERRRELAFSPPYMNNVAVLISHADRPELASPEQLSVAMRDRRAMAFSGTLHERRLRALAAAHWPEMPMDFTVSNAEILDAVASDTHFAYVDGYNFVRARSEGLPLRRHPAFDDPGETFGIIMPLNNDWQGLLAAFFAREGGLLASDWYRSLLAEHLGEEVAGLVATGPE